MVYCVKHTRTQGSPNGCIRVEEIGTCLLCGKGGAPLYSKIRDRMHSAPGSWNFLWCHQCGLVWLNPRPVYRDIGKVYSKYYTHTLTEEREKKPRPAPTPLSLIPRLKEKVGLSHLWLNGVQKGKLLDVGCGEGDFLMIMRKLGWDVQGIEPDEQSVRIARESFNLPVKTGTLEEAGFPDHYFDAVTMKHVIEHVHDPIGLLQECRRVLKPGGRLVTVTPNIEGLEHRIFREAWMHIAPPWHLYLFSLRALKACAEQAGLRIEMLRATARSAQGVWCASRLIQRYGRLPSEFPKNVSRTQFLQGMVVELFQHMIIPLGSRIGESLVLVALKE